MNHPQKLPVIALLALTVSGFIAILTEVLPAGLLPQISDSIGVSESYVGQFITMYALGSVLAAIPIISLTRNWNRKPLLLIAILGFFVFNLATFLLDSYSLLLVVRFFAGVSAGIIWGLLTGYTVRMVSSEMTGKALAIVGVGQPIALSLGVPLATWFGRIIGWNSIFLIISVLSLILLFWVIAFVPDFSIEKKTKSAPFKKILSNKGIRKILLITLFWILAHSLLYTYIVPFLKVSNLADHIDWMFFLFGTFSIIGIWLTSYFVDKYLKKLININLILFGLSGVLMLLGSISSVFACLGIALWGYSFGGAPILLQKDLADLSKENVDIAQAIFVTAFNIAVASGGLVGGVLLEYYGIPFLLLALILLALLSLLLIAYKGKLIKPKIV